MDILEELFLLFWVFEREMVRSSAWCCMNYEIWAHTHEKCICIFKKRTHYWKEEHGFNILDCHIVAFKTFLEIHFLQWDSDTTLISASKFPKMFHYYYKKKSTVFIKRHSYMQDFCLKWVHILLSQSPASPRSLCPVLEAIRLSLLPSCAMYILE